MNPPRNNIRLATFFTVSIGLIFIVAAGIVVISVNTSMRRQGLTEAQSKARLILDRNFATHTYFSLIMKPSIFAWSEPFRNKEYFNPTWMSSTYAIREIEKVFKSVSPSGFFYKDAALNARSPKNEADEYERTFLEKLKVDKKLESELTVRQIGGKSYLDVLKKGEVMEQSCLRCHGNPKDAPKGLTDYYGSERSFNRRIGDVISTISLRIPLSEAYAAANIFSLKLSAILLAVLVCLFILQNWIYRRYLLNPLNSIREKALQIVFHEGHLGEQISQLFGRELNEFTAAFNEMSVKLRQNRDHLEELVDNRTEALRQEKEFSENLIETAQVIILVLDPEGKILRFNSYMEKISGYSLDEVIGKDWSETFLPERERGALRELFLKAIGGIPTRGNVNAIVTKGGEERFIEWFDQTIHNAQGSIIGLLSIGQDITERKLQEEKIQASLREKETMLKEIHHRVKNNLQVVQSLLNLQAGEMKDPGAIEALRASRDRIRSMALVHEKLYQSPDLSSIDMADYLRNLSTRLLHSLQVSPDKVNFKLEVEEIQIGIEKAIPLGLILNELISNALKHAFPGGRAGEIRVGFARVDGGMIRLTVGDNGIGFPKEVDFSKTDSLGFQVITALVEQLEGTMEMKRDIETVFTITFRDWGI